MKQAIHPVGKRVLVIAEASKDVTASGIQLVKKVETPEMRGVVKEVGDVDKKLKGKTVFYPKYGFDEITFEGAVYHIVKEDDILAILS